MVSERSFFKEDIFSSPKFKLDPVKAEWQMKLRFVDDSSKELVKRSHVGQQQTFHDFEAKLRDESEMARQVSRVKKKKVMASKIVVLRKQLSSSKAGSTQNAQSAMNFGSLVKATY